MCERVQFADGTIAIVCYGHRQRRRKCIHCGTLASRLCDHRVGITSTGKHLTCDAPICEGCALRVGRKDYCQRHATHHAGDAPLPLPFEA